MILEQIVNLDIKDVTGTFVKYICQKKVECTKTGLDEFCFSLAPSGEVVDVEFSGGIIKEILKENGRTLIRTILSRSYNRGEKMTLELRCIFKNSFTDSEEKWTFTRNYPGKGPYSLTIQFPPLRPYKCSRAYKRHGHSKIMIEDQPNEKLINGKPSLIFNVEKLKIKEEYQVVWNW
jgi:hypothetical protein